jgi:hypothetical protein
MNELQIADVRLRGFRKLDAWGQAKTGSESFMAAKHSEHERIPMQYLIIEAAQDPTYSHEKERIQSRFDRAMPIGC